MEDDRRCDLCGARHIDTHEKVVRLTESEPYQCSPSLGVEKTQVGEGSNSLSPSRAKDKVQGIPFGIQSDSKSTRYVVKHALYDSDENRENGQSSQSAHASPASETIMNRQCGYS